MSDEVKVNVGCGGCLVVILLVIIGWALIFGVTIGGVHYGLSGCDEENGVQVDTGRAAPEAAR